MFERRTHQRGARNLFSPGRETWVNGKMNSSPAGRHFSLHPKSIIYTEPRLPQNSFLIPGSAGTNLFFSGLQRYIDNLAHQSKQRS
jgi:hypothetical protein